MFFFILENGIATESWCAVFAFRKRANISAIGSVIVIGFLAFLVVVSEFSSDLQR
jgi:hypothetical protein